MTYWKRYAAALIALSVLLLAGCKSDNSGPGGALPGPNAADEAAAKNNPVQKTGPPPGAGQGAAKGAPTAGATGQ
jgi:hypothetical protein